MKPIHQEALLDKVSQFIPNRALALNNLPVESYEVKVNEELLRPEVRADLQDNLSPLLKKLETSILISNVKNTADMMIDLGKHYHLDSMIVEGEELRRYAENCDIIQIKSKLRMIQKSIRKETGDVYEQSSTDR